MLSLLHSHHKPVEVTVVSINWLLQIEVDEPKLNGVIAADVDRIRAAHVVWIWKRKVRRCDDALTTRKRSVAAVYT